MASEHLIIVRTEIFKEDDVYIGLCPDLEVSSFGETVEEARQSLQEALNAFVDECAAMGTLDEVLEEAGFVREGSTWLTRQPLSIDLVPVGQVGLAG
jgi:predicted RNase H-like HicB family nuclease